MTSQHEKRRRQRTEAEGGEEVQHQRAVSDRHLVSGAVKHFPTEGDWSWKSIRCIDCAEFFSIREHKDQNYRYHRCAECAAKRHAAELERGNA